MAGIIESNGQIQIKERVPAGMRVFLSIVSLLPWLAPYELLIKPRWTGFGVPVIFFSLISLGAISVSLSILASAIFGLNQTLTVDPVTRTIRHAYENVIMPLRERKYSFIQLTSIEIMTHDWSDGPSTYGLKFTFGDEHKANLGSFASLDDASAAKEKIEQITTS
ncbi:MAG: hypothetical protein PHQ36_06225 [Anaerolineales bacterium]|nr:hypothetical protein [Anaerolineales bacterium]